MEIRVALMPALAGDVSNTVCVVIDMFRATTVIATLFDRRCPCVYVAASHETAERFARGQGYVLCGETGGMKVEGFDYGNSPVEFSRIDFADQPIVLSTTNGTKAVARVAAARRVYLGSAVNRTAVAEAAWWSASNLGVDIVLVCSGSDDHFTLEDATVAGLYVEALIAQGGPWTMPEQDDAAITCRRLWESEPNLLRGLIEGAHAKTLADRGFGEDLGFCCAIDALRCVPTLVSDRFEDDVTAPVLLVR